MADTTVVHWMAEYILRDQTISDGFAAALINALPSPPSSSSSSTDASPSFRRVILLRALSSDLSRRSISPRTLRIIELLQSLDLKSTSKSNPLAAEAYLSVATCVVASAPDFASAVKAVFLDRIGHVLKSPDASGLVSDRMKAVAAEMEKALADPVLREEVVGRSTLEDAMEAVRVFLEKEREEIELQPCPLEIALQEVAKRKSSTLKSIPSPEVKKVLDDLRSSCAELMGKVEDPLPEAIRFADEVAENLRAKVGETGVQVDMDVPGNRGEGTSTGIPKQGFMDRQPTAFCYEWEETELMSDDSEGTSRRFHLPSPKRIPISPLRRVPYQKLGVRRKAKRWTTLEEETLRKAVQELGRGNWKQMLNQYRFIFEERTEVDLKDKWRNMTR